jgi:hypothetical protein
MKNEEFLEVWEYYQRGPLPVRCHECNAPLFPGKYGTIICDGENLMNHKHVNVYRNFAARLDAEGGEKP